jgi:hypothetical protein
MYKEMYQKKFDTLMVREQGKVDYVVFKDNDNNDSYYIYFKIPSETVKGVYYDVVIRLFTTENSKKYDTYLRAYAVQFYSNDPAFYYTFAYSFQKNKLIIKDLAPKKIQKASSRNPKNDVWYVKSLYFAYLAMEKYNLFSRTVLDSKQTKYSLSALKKLIVDPERKLQDRKDQELKLKELERRQQDKQKSEERKLRNTGIATKGTKRTSIVHSVATTKTTKMTNATKRSKLITAIKKADKS